MLTWNAWTPIWPRYGRCASDWSMSSPHAGLAGHRAVAGADHAVREQMDADTDPADL